MKEDKKLTRTCPICGKEYTEAPAVSRSDGYTPICPDCGTRESLQSMGCDESEQNRILEIIHRAIR